MVRTFEQNPKKNMDGSPPIEYSHASERNSLKGNSAMFILALTYVKPNEEADKHMEPHMEPHMAWVRKGYAKGWFLASGRKVPRTGGVVLAIGQRAEIEAYVAEDPFTVHGIAEYEITEVAITTTAAGLDILKG
jgi:uncharacterized protein YciI